jgi:hypothetical protein
MGMLIAFKLSAIFMMIMMSSMIYNLWSTPSYERKNKTSPRFKQSFYCLIFIFGMSPTNLLNATCVADITSNYPVFTTTEVNMATACGISSSSRDVPWDKVDRGLTIIFIVFICVALADLIISLKMISRLGTTRDLWSTPSYELHEKLEDRYSSSLKKKAKRKKYEEDHAGRYKSVTYEDDAETKTRTITIIEDLTKVPLTKEEEEEKRKEDKKQDEKKKDEKRQENIPLRTLPKQDDGRNAPSWTPAGQAWARSQARENIFKTKLRESVLGGKTNVNVAPAATYVAPAANSAESRPVDGEQQAMVFPPLTYNAQDQGQGQQHKWTGYV